MSSVRALNARAGSRVLMNPSASASARVLLNARAPSSVLMLVLIALLPWQGALRFPTHSVTIVKLAGGVLFLSVVLATLVHDRPLRFTAVLGWAVLLCTELSLSLVASGLSGLSARETLRYWTLTLFLFLVVQLIDSRAAFVRALRVLALSTIVGAAWASVQFLDGSVERASGPISDPNDFAYLLAAMLPLTVYLLMSERRRGWRWLWAGGLVCLALGILGSSSRGAFVALAVTALWALATRRISPVVAVGALSTVVLIVVVALGISSARTAKNLQSRERGLSTSVNLREVYWSAALRMTANHPMLGIGPGRFEALSSGYVRNTPKLEHEIAVNSTYLGMLSEGGILALLLFVGFLAAVLRQILRALPRRGPPGKPRAPERWLRSAFLASFLIAVVGGVFFSAQLSTPLWFIAAFASALALLPAEEAAGI
jgi:putative inorganic carbon (HCO3(-)) transporter